MKPMARTERTRPKRQSQRNVDSSRGDGWCLGHGRTPSAGSLSDALAVGSQGRRASRLALIAAMWSSSSPAVSAMTSSSSVASGRSGSPASGSPGSTPSSGSPMGRALRDDEADPAVLAGVEAPALRVPHVAGRGADQPEGPEASAVRTALEAPVGERVVRGDLAGLRRRRGGAEVDGMVAAEAAARPERALLGGDGAVVEGGDDPATLVVEQAPQLGVALAPDDGGPRWLQAEGGEAVGEGVDGGLPLVGVGGVTVAAHALADGLGGGTDEAVAGVVEGHDAGGHAAVEGLAGRAIELRLELERARPLERRHQGRTRGRSTESRPAAVSSSGTSTGGLTS